MQLLIFGVTGMLGHRLASDLSEDFNVIGTVRDMGAARSAMNGPAPCRIVGGFHAERPASIGRLLDETGAEVAINCIGVVKQLDEAKDARRSIAINAMFPHELAAACRRRGVRLIHFSTDCVFSGRRGPYGEDETPDPVDLYGRSKLLGEVGDAGCLTLRTSMIGRELHGSHGLLEWFLSQRGGRIRGFRRALFTGLTTGAIAGIVRQLVLDFPDLSGIYHLAGEPIDKFTLLSRLDEALGTDVEIAPDDTFHCDRRLDGSRLAEATGIELPGWDRMIADMRAEAQRTRHVLDGRAMVPAAS